MKSKPIAWALIGIGLLRIVASADDAAFRNDFAHYYLSAKIWLAGENPYITPLAPHCEQYALEYDGRIPTGSNPPLLIAMVAAFAWLPVPMAYAIWAVLQVTAVIALLMAIRQALEIDRHSVRWWLIVGVVLNTTCLQRNFHYSQVQAIVAAGVAWALVLHLWKYRATACGLAMLAAALKIYPAVLVPWFLLAELRGWRDLLRRGAAVAGVGVAVLAVTGVNAWHEFAVDGLAVVHRSVGGSLTNYSLPSLTAVIAGEIWGWPLTPSVAALVALLGQILGAAALVAAYFVVWRRQIAPVPAIGVLTAAMLAASLVAWTHYFVLMVLPIAWLWRQSLASGTLRTRWPALVAASLCLWPELDWLIPVTTGVPRMLLHFYPLASLAIAAALLAQAARIRATKAA